MSSRHAALAALLVLLAVGALFAWRKPGSFFHPQFWAEDALIFHREAELYGARTLLAPHVGYHHFIPRLVAFVARDGVDPAWQPAFYNFSALAVALALAVSALRSLPQRPAGLAAALALALVPQIWETSLSLTNVQWIAALYLPLLLARDARPGWWRRAVETLAAAAVGLTGPFAILFAPLFWLRATWGRRRDLLAPAVVLTLAAGAQLHALNHAPPYAFPIVDAPPAWPHILGYRMVAQNFLPFLPFDRTSFALCTALAVAAVPAAGALAVSRGATRAMRGWLLAAAAALLAGVIYRNHVARQLLLEPDLGQRYFYPLRVLAAWLLVLLACDRAARRPARVLGGAAAVALALSATRQWSDRPWPDLRWDDYAARVRAHEPVSIPVNPPPFIYDYPGRPPR